nr:hypothetical protein [Allomuricauda sp.]
MKRSYWDFVISFSTTNLLSNVSILSLSWPSSLVNRFWSSSASWFLSIKVSCMISANGSIYFLSASAYLPNTFRNSLWSLLALLFSLLPLRLFL